MDDQSPLGLSVFAPDAKQPLPDAINPVGDLAEKGPVAPLTGFTSASNEAFDAAQVDDERKKKLEAASAAANTPDEPWVAATKDRISQLQDTSQRLPGEQDADYQERSSKINNELGLLQSELPAKQDDARSAFRLWADEDSSVAAMIRLSEATGYKYDPNYRLPAPDTDQWKQLSKGIPDQYLDRLSGAVNGDHAQYIANQIRHELASEQEWNDHSKWGRLGLGLVDPVNLGLMLTGAGELNDVSRIARFVKGGLMDSAMFGATQAFLDTGKQTANGYDVASAALQGFVMGGALHAVLPAHAIPKASDDILKAHREIALDNLADRIDQGLPTSAIDPKVLDELKQREVVTKAAEAHDAVHEHVDQQRASLVEMAADGGTQKELRAADQEATTHQNNLDAARKELEQIPDAKTADELTPDILARMREEDKGVHGEENVDDKKLVKERARAAKAEAAVAEEKAKADHVAAKSEVMDRIDTHEDRLTRQTDIVEKMKQGQWAQKALKEHDTAVAKAGENIKAKAGALLDANKRSELLDALDGGKEPEGEPGGMQSAETPVGTDGSVPEAKGMNGEFGEDSGGAARASDVVAPAVEINPSEHPISVPQSSRVGKFLNWGPFKTFSSVLRGSDNSIVRDRLGRMFGEAIAARTVKHTVTDAAGNKTVVDKVMSGTVGASDHASMLKHAWDSEAGRIRYAFKDAWMREKGLNGLGKQWNNDVEHQWATEVGKHIRGIKSESKPVQEAAKRYSELYKDILKEAKRAGVKGFDSVPANEHYLPRIFDFDQIKQMNAQLGDGGMQKFLGDALEKGMTGAGLERDTIDKIAAGYLARTKRLGLGIDNEMMNGIRLDDVDYMRDLLSEALPRNEVEDAIDSLRQKMKTEGRGEGDAKFAKHRVQFDETHTIQVKDANGNLTPMSIADMFSNDATALTERYTRTMSGAVGLARVGIKSEADFTKGLHESISSLSESGAKRGEIETVRAYAEGGYKALMGRPLDNESLGMMQKASFLARDYAYTRSMNQSGFSIANNLIRPWTNGYAKYSSKYLPAMGELFSRDENGKLNHDLLSEVERFTGIGSDSVNMHIYHHGESDTAVGKALEWTGQKLKVAGRITSHISGMTPGLVAGQRLMANGIIDRLVRNAFGEADLPAKRLAIMGLDDDMMGRIKAELKANSVEAGDSGNGPTRAVNWANWKDLEARDSMLTAVFRETRILIHGEDIASTGLWMNKWWGRLAIQLRRFPMMAMSKQLGRGLHMRDMDTLVDFMVTGAVGTASFAAQTYLKSLGMGGSEGQKYLDKNMNMGHLIAAGLQRSPYSGMAPQVIDTVALHTVGAPVFDARGSGLSSDLLGGTPVVDALSKLSTVISQPAQAMFQNGHPYTQKEWKALTSAMPLGNALPMVWLTNAMSQDFPKNEPKQHHQDSGGLLEQSINQ